MASEWVLIELSQVYLSTTARTASHSFRDQFEWIRVEQEKLPQLATNWGRDNDWASCSRNNSNSWAPGRVVAPEASLGSCPERDAEQEVELSRCRINFNVANWRRSLKQGLRSSPVQSCRFFVHSYFVWTKHASGGCLARAASNESRTKPPRRRYWLYARTA